MHSVQLHVYRSYYTNITSYFLSKSWKYIFAKGMFITNIRTYGMSVTHQKFIFGMPLRFSVWLFPSVKTGWHFLIPCNSSPCSVDLNTSLSESLPVHCQNHCPIVFNIHSAHTTLPQNSLQISSPWPMQLGATLRAHSESTHLTCGTYLRPQYAIFRLKLRIQD